MIWVVLWLRLALSNGPNKVSPASLLKTETNQVSEMLCFLYISIVSDGGQSPQIQWFWLLCIIVTILQIVALLVFQSGSSHYSSVFWLNLNVEIGTRVSSIVIIFPNYSCLFLILISTTKAFSCNFHSCGSPERISAFCYVSGVNFSILARR
jgi:hypothetical protein